MKQVLTKHFPFGGFKALAAWPFIFIRSDKAFTETDLRHEKIHGAQQVELLPVAAVIAGIMAFAGCGWWSLLALLLYVVLYGLFGLKEMVHCGIDKERGQVANPWYKKRNYWHRVEHSVILEREAYTMQGDPLYLDRRPFLAWVRF